MTWTCAAIDHGVTIFPNEMIGPCCKISADYLKPLSQLANPQRFADLKTESPPDACHSCVDAEHRQMPSYRNIFNSLVTSSPGLQFVDIRNTNLCNLKCRYCGPHFSSQWAKELQRTIPIVSTTFDKTLIITDSLQWMYFTGGEPMINNDHWNLLEELIKSNRAKDIMLVYNSNLTTLKYKDKSIVDIWAHFKKIEINCSIDAVGKTFEYIRSGADWKKVSANIDTLRQLPVSISLCPVISLLNIWHIDQLCEYADRVSIKINPVVLSGPDYLALNVIPDQLKQQALTAAQAMKKHIDNNTYNHIVGLIENNINQCLFKHAMSHILLLDNLRSEKLFDLLPFKNIAQTEILENHEYESK
jgi:sulfatase maturation enzyme AslB (radical SAM superfamily)